MNRGGGEGKTQYKEGDDDEDKETGEKREERRIKGKETREEETIGGREMKSREMNRRGGDTREVKMRKKEDRSVEVEEERSGG